MKLCLTFTMFLLKLAAVASDPFVNTTRYWDCCKPSCGWNGKASLSKGPVQSCAADGSVIGDNVQSGCESDGSAYQCASQSPWAINDSLAYGWAAAAIDGELEKDWCCACYQLTFTTQIVGKEMIVQVINSGGQVDTPAVGNYFDIMMPGGGVGYYTDGCRKQWGAPENGWGQQYGGVDSAAECSQLPSALQAGCNFRFDWMKGSSNPTMSFHRVKCPTEITDKSGCVRDDESSFTG